MFRLLLSNYHQRKAQFLATNCEQGGSQLMGGRGVVSHDTSASGNGKVETLI